MAKPIVNVCPGNPGAREHLGREPKGQGHSWIRPGPRCCMQVWGPGPVQATACSCGLQAGPGLEHICLMVQFVD